MRLYNEFEWLCMVHKESVAEMKDMLKVLKRRSILEKLCDDYTMLGMHDLWREFAVLESSKVQDCRDPRWVYQADGRRAICRSGQWRESMERMMFVNEGWKDLEGLHLADFVNVEAFQLTVEVLPQGCSLALDLSGLMSLKSLEIGIRGLAVRSDGLSSLTNLGYLDWSTPGVSQCLDGIGRLIALQVLQLYKCEGVKVLDLTELKSLRVVSLISLPDLIRVVGLSSKMVSFRYLLISSCGLFRDCPFLGELFGLEELEIRWCEKLVELPCLGRLIRLRMLNISGCKSLRAVRGLGDLVNLEDLDAFGCSKLALLPSLAKLTKLHRLDLDGCPLQEVPGLDGLFALTTLGASFSNLQGELPVLSKLSTLILLSIEGWNGKIWTIIIQNLPMLEELDLTDCKGEDVVPDLQNLRVLKIVRFWRCNFKDLWGLSNSTALGSLSIFYCEDLQRLPEFERLTSLRDLCIQDCHSICEWPRVSSLCSLQGLEIDSFSVVKIVFALETLLSLRELKLQGSECEYVLSMASLSQVEILSIRSFKTMEALDLSNFPLLKELEIFGCHALRRVTCSIPLTGLIKFRVSHCQILVELPDLSAFPQLETLELHYCNCALTRLSCSRPLTTLREIEVLVYCGDGIEILPELTWFPNLVRTRVEGITSLEEDIAPSNDGIGILPELTWFPNLVGTRAEGITSLEEDIAPSDDDDEGDGNRDASGKGYHLRKLLLRYCCHRCSE